ncbi:MAG: trypsin-like peptidase domain-containing protein [Clostridia bacterium]|nr:trypsin-like peptidase domain-containing protein [Clostridia bacterium]
MKKMWKTVCASVCAGLCLISFAGCSLGENGKTAYEIACENGFVGTEAEWLASLKGADGDDAPAVDLPALYASLVQSGDYTGSYTDFLKTYFSVNVQEDNDVQMISSNMTSIVAVQCGFQKTAYGQTVTSGSWGSGVILDLDKENGNALIVTNYHVIYDADSNSQTGISNDIYVYLYGGVTSSTTLGGGDSIRASYVGGAIEYDIAVIQIAGSEDLKQSAATEAKIGSSGTASIGEKVFVMGNPAGEGLAVTSGILSKDFETIAISMEIKTGGSYNATRDIDYRVMRTDAPINSGNSGGGLFNAKGELIGIVNAKTVSSNIDNMGYALPIDNVKAVYQNVLDNAGTVKIADLGLTLKTLTASGYIGENGTLKIKEEVVVSGVAIGSALSGALAMNDVLVSFTINGVETKIDRAYQVEDLALTMRKGDQVIVKFKRSGMFSGEEKTVSITLGVNDFLTVA